MDPARSGQRHGRPVPDTDNLGIETVCQPHEIVGDEVIKCAQRKMSEVSTDRADPQGGPVEHHGGVISGNEMADVEVTVAENLRDAAQRSEQIIPLGPHRSEPRIGVDRSPVQVADRDTLRELVSGQPRQVRHRRARLPRAEPVRCDTRRLRRSIDVLEVHRVINDAVAAWRHQPWSRGQHPRRIGQWFSSPVRPVPWVGSASRVPTGNKRPKLLADHRESLLPAAGSDTPGQSRNGTGRRAGTTCDRLCGASDDNGIRCTHRRREHGRRDRVAHPSNLGVPRRDRARQAESRAMTCGSPGGTTVLTRAFCRGAGDGNRTRTVSLGS